MKQRIVWSLRLALVAIGLLAVARRTYVLLNPPPPGPPRFAAAALGAGFARHPALTSEQIFP